MGFTPKPDGVTPNSDFFWDYANYARAGVTTPFLPKILSISLFLESSHLPFFNKKKLKKFSEKFLFDF